MPLDPKEFGHFVAKKRDEKRLSQAVVADAVGISRPYLAQIENGRLPSDEVMQGILLVLGVRMAEFIEDNLRGRVPDEQVDALKNLMEPYDALSEHMEPKTLLDTLKQTTSMERIVENLAPFSDTDFDFGPKGWSELNKTDRALVQRIINRLLKTKGGTSDARQA